MAKINTNFVITKVSWLDTQINIHYTINYASHKWDRVLIIQPDHDEFKSFTYEELRRRVRAEAMRLINKRAPVENNIRRIEKMIGEERSF